MAGIDDAIEADEAEHPAYDEWGNYHYLLDCAKQMGVRGSGVLLMLGILLEAHMQGVSVLSFLNMEAVVGHFREERTSGG